MSAAATGASVSYSAARNVEHALAAIGVLFDPGDVIEIRAIDVRRDAIQHGSDKLNPVLLARTNNSLQAGLKNTTADADTIERRWLYIDVDARCPAGISSSDPEHEDSLQRALNIPLGQNRGAFGVSVRPR